MPGRKKNRIHLEDIPRENPFTAPEGYFEDFTSRLNQRIADKKPTVKMTTRWQAARSQLALAASFIILAAFAYGIIRFMPFKSLSGNINYADVVENSLENYDMDLLSGIYDEQISAESADEDTTYTGALVTYLVDQDVDLDLIMEDLK